MKKNRTYAKTVFICSRTEEVALERRAAFEGVCNAGLVPIMFDSPLTILVNKDVGAPRSPRYELRQDHKDNKREIREQIDILLDRSDLFIGICFLTLGNPEYSINQLTWIEYEFFRFITRHWLTDDEHLKYSEDLYPEPLSVIERKKRLINDKLRNQSYIRQLRKHIKNGDKSHPVQQILRDRVRFYVRYSKDAKPKRKVVEFKSLLPNHIITRIENKLDTLNPAIQDQKNYPAHAGLYNQLTRLFNDSQRFNPHFTEMLPPDDNVFIAIKGDDKPRLLYLVLRELFHLGLNILFLLVKVSPSQLQGNDRYSIQMWVEPFCIDPPYHNVDLKEHLELSLDKAQVPEFEIEVTKQKEEPTRFDNEACLHESDWEYGCCITFVDVPGVLWSLATLATANKMNIRFLTYDKELARHGFWPSESKYNNCNVVAFHIGLSRIPWHDAEQFDQQVASFTYQLRCIHGFIGAEPLSKA